MSKQTKKHNLIIVAFYASMKSGCDYATQTIDILGKRHSVIGFALGEPITWRDIFSFGDKKRVVEEYKRYTIFRPFFVIPGQRLVFIKQMNLFVNAVLLRTFISIYHTQEKKYFWFFEPFFIPTMLRVFSSYITIFDCVDYFLTVQRPFLSHAISAIQRATHGFVNSYTLKKQLSRHRTDISVVPLGFAYDLFCHAQRVKEKKGTKQVCIGYIGGIDERLDYKLLYNTARSLPTAIFVFVGTNYFSYNTAPRFFKLLYSLQNVTFIGEVSKLKIPAMIQSFDICLIPYDCKQLFNLYCFPMKTLEYFYYGKPVFATDIQELRRFNQELIIIHSYTELVHKIKYVMKKGWPQNIQKKQITHATRNSWEKKIHAIEQHIF
ncbi:MAG: glycosyltransferase [Candidatus Gottesmanbacteria bacterium]